MNRFRVVEYHHQVLEAWEECRKNSAEPPMVISLDFHTDVLNSSRRGVCFPATAAEAVKILHHDEHFDWALRTGIICKAVIAALSPCAVLPEHPALEVRRNDELPEMEVMLNEPEKFRSLASMVLDDRFLIPLLGDAVPQGAYILDIDCDVIMCESALFPENSAFIDSLASGAEMITFSREEEWVRILKLPGEKITGKMIADNLIRRWGGGIFPEKSF